MRDTKNITITEGENEYKFRLTKLSAREQSRWLIRLTIQLAKAGLLDIDLKEVFTSGDLGMDKLVGALLDKGLSFIGNLDADEVETLLLDLVEKSAQRITKDALTPATARELDLLFNSMTSLFALYREVIKLNFPFLGGGAQATDTSLPSTQEPAQEPRASISIPATSRRH